MTTKRSEERKELFFKVNKRMTKETTLIAQIEKEIRGGYATLAAIALFMDEDGRAFPSQAELAKQCGVSRQTINARIKALTEFRTKDGQAVLEAETVREGMDKTRTFYRLLPASGMTFIHDVPNEVVKSALQANEDNQEQSSNKVVKSALQRQEVAEGCEETEEGCQVGLTGVVTKSDRLSSGFDSNKNSVITKSNNKISYITITNKGGAIVEKENKSLLENNKDNIQISIVEDKESKDLAKDTNSNKPDIVAKDSEKKTEITEDQDGHGTGHTAAKQTIEVKQSESLSLEQIARERAARAADVQAEARRKYIEEQKRFDSAYYGRKNVHMAL
jgi:hypothetical protein